MSLIETTSLYLYPMLSISPTRIHIEELSLAKSFHNDQVVTIGGWGYFVAKRLSWLNFCQKAIFETKCII